MIEVRKITDVPQYLNGVKAVVFDLDDTLYSEKEYIKSGYKAVASIVPEIENAESRMWAFFEDGKSAIDELLLSEEIYSHELKEKCLEVYRFHRPDIHLYDGVVEMLTQFRAQGLQLGIITDGRPEGQRAKIKALRLNEYVDHIIVTDELGGVEYRKPHTQAFVLMKNRLNVGFSEMCYVGDNIRKDFIPCNRLGIRSIYVANPDGLYFDSNLSEDKSAKETV